MPLRPNPDQSRLPATFRPAPITLSLPAIRQVDETERELRYHAQADNNQCCGYFPSLTGHPGISVALPACRDFASIMPTITHAGVTYRFNFIRLSLTCQSSLPTYHLDTDAATALTGDPATLGQRQVGRILLNLSARDQRALHYLDLDVAATPLTREGSYVRASEGADITRYARFAAIPPRTGTIVHGIRFASSHVLHSGVDGPHGHFVAAYGYDHDTAASPLRGRVDEPARPGWCPAPRVGWIRRQFWSY
jgi:hypothetical protein